MSLPVADSTVRVVTSGDEGPDLVLIHGFAANNVSWKRWVPRLRDRFRLHLLEMKGHGEAPAPKDDRYSPFDHADGVAAYVRSIGRPVVLVGHSMGGGVALITALKLQGESPGLVRGIVSISGAAYPQPLPPFVTLSRRGLLARFVFWLLPKRFLIRRVLRAIVFDPDVIEEPYVEAYARPLTRSRNRNAILQTAIQIVPDDMDSLAERFRTIDCPVLALWGRNDRVVPLAVGERLERELPDVRLVVLDECGHIPMDEQTERSLAAVEAFLDELPTTAP